MAIWNVTATKLLEGKWCHLGASRLFSFVEFLPLCPQSSPCNPDSNHVFQFMKKKKLIIMNHTISFVFLIKYLFELMLQLLPNTLHQRSFSFGGNERSKAQTISAVHASFIYVGITLSLVFFIVRHCCTCSFSGGYTCSCTIDSFTLNLPYFLCMHQIVNDGKDHTFYIWFS